MSSDVAELPATVLVFDDSEICLDIVAVALEDAGFSVVTEATADDPEGRVRQAAPSVVVLDISMPGTDVVTMARRIRAAAGGNVPIILHSDRASSELEAHVRACEATSGVPKTADGDLLLEAIRAALTLIAPT